MPSSTTNTPSAANLPSAIHRIVASIALSKMGDNFTEIALVVFVLGLTHNVADLGLVLAMAFLPRLLLGPLLAGWIDRLPKRATLLISDFARAGLVLSIPLIHNYWYTVVAVAIMYTFALVYTPLLRDAQTRIASDASTTQRASVRQELYLSYGDLITYALAGGLIALFGVATAFGLDALSYVASALIVISLKVEPAVWARVSHSMTVKWSASVREAVIFIRRDRLVLFVVILSALLNLAIGAINTVVAPLSSDLWHVSTSHYAYLMVAMASGALIAGTLMDKRGWATRWSPATNVALGAVLTGIGIGGTLIAGSWWLGLIAIFIGGAGNPFYGSAVMALVQNSTTDAVRARVLILRSTVMGLGGAMGAWGSGVLAHQFGLSVAVILVAGLWILLAGVTVVGFQTHGASSREFTI